VSGDVLTIASGNSLCTVAPSIGGSLADWEVDGQQMLRSAKHMALATGDVLGSASFPLVPYSNRIGFARFDWNGRAIELPPHPIATPHAIHGIGWDSAWNVEAQDAHSVALALNFAGDSRWPWPFEARQSIEVTADSLKLWLSATNLANEAVPLAFGHHPYFDAAGAVLQFVARNFYPTAGQGLPGKPILPAGDTDFAEPRSVGGLLIDNIYGEWSGLAHIAWEGRRYTLEVTSSLPHAVLYTPAAEGFFCFEPVANLTNALNRDDGDIPIIAPGESFSAWIGFRAIDT
jgi:aldose 1-epimerase